MQQPEITQDQQVVLAPTQSPQCPTPCLEGREIDGALRLAIAAKLQLEMRKVQNMPAEFKMRDHLMKFPGPVRPVSPIAKGNHAVRSKAAQILTALLDPIVREALDMVPQDIMETIAAAGINQVVLTPMGDGERSLVVEDQDQVVVTSRMGGCRTVVLPDPEEKVVGQSVTRVGVEVRRSGLNSSPRPLETSFHYTLENGTRCDKRFWISEKSSPMGKTLVRRSARVVSLPPTPQKPPAPSTESHG